MKLTNLILEGTTLFVVDILIKTKKEANRIEIYNQIRALTNVVVVSIEQNDFLDSKATDQFDYEMLHLKFLATEEPKAVINSIKKDALITKRIPGLLQFIIRYKTIIAKGKY